MTEIKRNSYKGKEIAENFNWYRSNSSPVYSIYDFYGRPSGNKYKAFEYCRRQYEENEGVGGMYCLGHNSCFFSIGYMTKSGDIVKHTASYDYIVK